MSSLKWLVLAVFFLSSCAPVNTNISSEPSAKIWEPTLVTQKRADKYEEQEGKIELFKKLKTISGELISATKDFEGKLWIVLPSGVNTLENSVLKAEELNGRYKGVPVEALGTKRGFYVFFDESNKVPPYGFIPGSRKQFDSAKYYNGTRYLEVWRGKGDASQCFVDSTGRLWIPGKEKKVTVIDGMNRFEFTYKTKIVTGRQREGRKKNSLPLKFYEDTKKRVWIYSDYYIRSGLDDNEFIDGFLCFDNGALYRLPVTFRANDEIVGLLELPSGEFLVSFFTGGTWLFDYKKEKDSVALTPKGSALAALKDHVIVDSFRTKDGRIIAVTGNRMTETGYQIDYSLHLLYEDKVRLLQASIDSKSSFYYERDCWREFCEDAEGSVWLNGENVKVFRVDKEGGVKQFDWNDGLLQSKIRKIISVANLVYLVGGSANMNSDYDKASDLYVYDTKNSHKEIKTGWTALNSLCLPVADPVGNVWLVDNEGWLKKYTESGSEKVFNVFEKVKSIAKEDRLGNPEFIGICNGINDDIWLLVGSHELRIVSVKGKLIKDFKLKDMYAKIAAEKTWRSLDLKNIRKAVAEFSPDGYIVLADYHFNRKVFIFNKSRWDVLESIDISGVNGFIVSDPLSTADGSLAVTLFDGDPNKPVASYKLNAGKWEKLGEVLKARYDIPVFPEAREEFKSAEGVKFSFIDNNIRVSWPGGQRASIPVQKNLRYYTRFAVKNTLWLTLFPEQWNRRQDFMSNHINYPVYKYDCGFYVSGAGEQQETDLEKPVAQKIPVTELPPAPPALLPRVEIVSLEQAFVLLKDGTAAEKQNAEKYFVNAGPKGREHLLRMLEQEKDDNVRWIIEALLSK